MGQNDRYPIGIGTLAKQTRCKVETIRYYEQKGLMPAPPRTTGGHRLYTKEMAGRLQFIRRSRELGFSTIEVRELLSIIDGKQVSCEQVKQITEMHLSDIRAKITDLRKMQRTLSDLSSRCSGKNVPECPIIDVLQE